MLLMYTFLLNKAKQCLALGPFINDYYVLSVDLMSHNIITELLYMLDISKNLSAWVSPRRSHQTVSCCGSTHGNQRSTQQCSTEYTSR